MRERMRSALPAIIVALVLGVVLGGAAVAAVSIPDHSSGWNKPTYKVQKRIDGGPRFAGPPVRLIPGPVGPQGKQGERGEVGPEGPSGATEPKCELVEGECLIYGNEFWRLQAALEPFEIDTGEYPEPPFCMKAVAEGEPLACPQAISYLYPDGTLGEAPWVLDADDPKGWRLF
jgi:hypothetical protein